MSHPTQQSPSLKDVACTIAEIVVEAGQIPSGSVYAFVMGNVSLIDYQDILAALTRGGILKVDNHVLISTFVRQAPEKA